MKSFNQFVIEKKRHSDPYMKPDRNIDDYDQEFVKWIETKLQRKIGSLLGVGAEGLVYEFGKGRVIKFTHYDRSTNLASFLQNKNIPGVYKIYSTGIIHLPERLHYTWITDTYGEGLEIDKYSDDHTLAYVIMERLYTKGVKEEINELTEIGNQFVKQTKDQYSKFYKDAKMVWTDILICLKHAVNTNNKSYIKEFKQYLKDTNNKGQLKLVDEVIGVFKNLKKVGIDWEDHHSGNWARNTKGDLVALDVDDGFDSTKNGFPIKNVIRENNIIYA